MKGGNRVKNKNLEFTKDLGSEFSSLIKIENQKQSLRNGIIIAILAISIIIGIINLVLSKRALSQTREINDYTKTEEKLYQTLEITYDNDLNINFDNINNIEETTYKTITIKNKGNSKAIFDLKINSIKTSLVDQNVLSYKITKNDILLGNKKLPLKETNIDSEVIIEPGSTITYKIEINKISNIDIENPHFYANIVVVPNHNQTIAEN